MGQSGGQVYAGGAAPHTINLYFLSVPRSLFCGCLKAISTGCRGQLTSALSRLMHKQTLTQHFMALLVPGTLPFHYASQSCTAPWESRLGECGLCIPASINRHLVVKNWLLGNRSQNLLFFVPALFLLRQ